MDSTTTLNAIAIIPGPYLRRSMVASAQYTIKGTQASSSKASAPEPVAPSNVAGSAILRQGTPVHLVFATEVNSKTADVGDKIQLTLAEDIKAGDMVLVAKGSPAVATVTQVDKTGAGGAPNAAVLVPYVGLFTLFRHGKDAEIKPGTPVTAYVDADTSLSSTNWANPPGN
jgi:hypothetical protein